MKKFIENTNIDRDVFYAECECGLHILKLEKLKTADEVVLSCIGGDDSDFLISGVDKINEFYKLCCQTVNRNKNGGYILNDDYYLNIYYESTDNTYNFILTNLDQDKIFWTIILRKDAFREFTWMVKTFLDKMIGDRFQFKCGTKVRVKSLDEMTPIFIDSADRYHFDLYDGTDIIFNSDMKTLCGKEFEVNCVNYYVDPHNCTRATFYLNLIDDPKQIILYTFTPDMVDILV